jgi:hypothetical protein
VTFTLTAPLLQFPEEDWTHLMALCRTAPDRYSERVLEEATAMINSSV